MDTIYLRASSKSIMTAALSAAGFLDSDGEVVTDTRDYTIDVFGNAYSSSGQKSSGYHANLIWMSADPLPDSISAIIIDRPATPYRVFA